MKARPRSILLFPLAIALGLSPAQARGDLISLASQPGLAGLGSFQGSLDYQASDGQSAVLTVVLKNTSPVDNGGYLTAFVLNNPGNSITTASLTGPAHFALLGAPGFGNGINGAPFGHFDFGAGTGGSFLGGGAPNKGLGVGMTGTFTFTLTGDGLDALTARSFLPAGSVPPGAGEGPMPFVARFRGFADGGSDKVPGDKVPEPPLRPAEVDMPEPATLGMAGAGLLTLLGWGCLRRKRPA
jgi:hypothetical protein